MDPAAKVKAAQEAMFAEFTTKIVSMITETLLVPMLWLLGGLVLLLLVKVALGGRIGSGGSRSRRGRSSGGEAILKLVIVVMIGAAFIPPVRTAIFHALGWIGIGLAAVGGVALAIYALRPRFLTETLGKVRPGPAPASPSRYLAAKRIGDEGEAAVANALRLSGLPHLNNLTMPIKEGTTQIDHVVLAGRTVVCLEVKNWNGMVYGRYADRHWTVFDRGGRKHMHQNPIGQNRRHVAALAKAFPDRDVRSFVVMAGRASFKEIPPGVVMLDELPRLVASIATGQTPPELREQWDRLTRYHGSRRHAEVAERHKFYMKAERRDAKPSHERTEKSSVGPATV